MALAAALSALFLLLAPTTQAFYTSADDPDCVGGQIGSVLWGCGTGGSGGPSGPPPNHYDQFGILGDWGYVGYHQGGGIYRPPSRYFVKRDYGAKGDGVTDDTAAFEKAIAAWTADPEKSNNGIILVERGNYVITRPLVFTKTGTVLRGAGKQGTFSETNLIFKGSLAALGKNVQKDAWLTWQGQGDDLTAANKLATVVAPAVRGSTKIFVDSTANIPAGTNIVLAMFETAAGDLQKLFLGGQLGQAGIAPGLYKGQPLFTFSAAVSFKGLLNGKPYIRLSRVLPLAISTLATAPAIYKYAPSVAEVGIELIGIKFPWSLYGGVGKETGNNAIAFKGVSQFYLHQVNITNADFGVLATNSRAGTLTGIVYNSDLPRGDLGDSTSFAKFSDRTTDSLALHFKITNRVSRTIVVDTFSGMNAFTGNDVASNGDLNVILGASAPWSNLFSALTIGNGRVFFWDGPAAQFGPSAGAWNTFYNIGSKKKQSLNPGVADKLQGSGLLVLGVNLDDKAIAVAKANKWYLEGVGPMRTLSPNNMYTAQVYSRNNRFKAMQ